jgi:peptide/nickel transport system permease protein
VNVSGDSSSVKALVLGRRQRRPAAIVQRAPRFRWTQWIGLGVSVVVVVVVLIWAFAPQLFTVDGPYTVHPEQALQGPSWSHIFGTDYIGRDLYTRIVYGASQSLKGSAVAVLIALVVGSLIGLVSGFVGGIVDTLVMRCIDVLLAIPGLLLAMAVVTALGFGIIKVAIAVGVASVAVFARLMRAEVYRIVGMRYIEASRLVGSSRLRILFRHILPNAAGTVLTLAALEFGAALLAISALSFLGYGTQPPKPEWGSLISDGRDYFQTAWWLAVLPGAVIAVVVLSANRISRALDPEQRVIL